MKRMVALCCLSAVPVFGFDLTPVPDIPLKGPEIPQVQAGDTAWKSAPPQAELGKEPFAAQVRMAASPEALLFHITVADAEHINTQSDDSIWKGDCVQIAVDALGNGAPPESIPGEWEFDTDDADFGFALHSRSGEVSGWSWHHGQLGRGQHEKNRLARITRDEEKKLTVYDIAIPWEEFGLAGGIPAQIGAGLKISNSSGPDKGELLWGGGAGGKVVASKMEKINVSLPADMNALTISCAAVRSVSDAFMLYGVCSAPSVLEVAINGKPRQISCPAGRFTVKVSLDEMPQGLLPVSARLTQNGQPVAQARAELFDDTHDRWFPFKTAQRSLIDKPEKYQGTAASLNDWFDGPAGERGRPQMKGEQFVLKDGTPVKFWGVNQSYTQCAPAKADAERWVRTWRKYGVNLVRMHKFSNHSGNGIGGGHAGALFDEKLLDQFDNYMAEMKKGGVYYSFSPLFGFWLGSQQIKDIKYPEYFAGKTRKDTSCYSLVNIAPDVQDKVIEWVVALMDHKNRYTGVRYAEEPALLFVEMQNEDDLLWYPTHEALFKYPKYGRDFCGRFSDWLKEKYGTHEALAAAWGETAISSRAKKTGYYEMQSKLFDEDESLDQRNILCICSPWYFSETGLEDQHSNPALRSRQRLIDNAQFLLKCQQEFYGKYRDALRAAGYEGTLIGSCWQAGEGLPHYINLFTDAEIGLIDRHNYYGGLPGFALKPGFMSSIPMLAQPGLGLLSSGMQQVADRPFSLSEWNGCAPYEWRQETPVIIAAYGMGLQGWDVSCQFDMADGYFDNGFESKFPVGTADQIGLYPVLTRMVLRGDIKESTPVSVRNVCMADLLKTGALGFEEKTMQAGDEKSFTGKEAPHQALTVGRTVVQFTETPQPTEVFDAEAHKQDGAYVSVTGQLRWKATGSGTGYIVINSDGTQGLTGFMPEQPFELGAVTITPDSLFCSILLTAAGKDETLADCKTALLQVMGRTANTGMKLDRSRSVVIDPGKGPQLLEPVFASIQLKRPVSAVHVLDHDGLRTGTEIAVEDGAFTIDGTRDHAIYYEVEYK